MSDPSRRFYGPCLTSGEEPALDIGTLAERLLVFDSVVLASARLTEVDGLVRAFGFEGTMRLIESRDLQLHAEALVTGARAGPSLPAGSFELVTVRAANRKAVTSGWLQQVLSIPGLTYREAKKLKSAVGTHLVFAADRAGLETRSETGIDVDGRPELVRFALALSVEAETGSLIPQGQLEVEVTRDGNTYAVRSNIAGRFGVNPSREHEVAKKAILAIANLNEQIERMQEFNAIVGFRDTDVALYEQKLRIFARFQGADSTPQLARVLIASGLPDLGQAACAGKLDYNRLLEVRSSDEAKEFRDWLRRAGDVSDDELKRQLTGLSARVGRGLNTSTGRVLRVLVPTVATMGLDPLLGTAVGTAVGMLDQFIWDKILPKRGPWSLVAEEFPSLFKD